MQTIQLNLIKKNRVYFKCTNQKGYEVKLKIDEKSSKLELGEQTLLVNDISVRSKYGTDLIYELFSELKDEGIVTLNHRYNCLLVERCRELGGRFDGDTKSWVFPKIVEDKVEELEFDYNHDIVYVEITAKENISKWQNSVDFNGYQIAKSTGRDSGAIVCNHVSMINGEINSGGSMKNWHTVVKEGSCFRLSISNNLLIKSSEECKQKWEIQIIK